MLGKGNEREREGGDGKGDREKLLTSEMASEYELDAHDPSAVYIIDSKATRTIRQILLTIVNRFDINRQSSLEKFVFGNKI